MAANHLDRSFLRFQHFTFASCHALRSRGRARLILGAATGAAVGALLIAPTYAAPPFADVFRLDPPVSGLESGVLIPGVDGAFLHYDVLQPDGPEGIVDWVSMGSRFDAAGDLVWSLRPEALQAVFGTAFPTEIPETPPLLDPAAGFARLAQTYASVAPLVADAAKARATYSLETGILRFGVVDAATQVPAFAFELAFDPATELLYSNAGPSDVELVIRTRRDSVDLLAVDPSGVVVFDTRYTSPAFLDSAGTEGRIQTASVSAHAAGYYVIAHVAEELSPAGVGTPVPYHCAILSLDLAGSVTWAKKLARSEPEPTGDLSPDFCSSYAVGPDGSFVLTMLDSTFAAAGGESAGRTHAAAVRADGTLAWAESYEDASLIVGGFAPDGSYLLMTGQVQPPGSGVLSAAGVIARVDALTGLPTHEFRLPLEDATSALLAMVATSDAYIYAGRWIVEGVDPFGGLTVEIIRLDHELASPTAFRQPGGAWQYGGNTFDESGLLISEFDAATGELRAFNVDENLVPFDPTCPRAQFEAAPVLAGTPGLTAAPLTLTLEPIVVAAAPAGTTLTAAALPVQPLGVIATICASAPTVPVPPTPALPTPPLPTPSPPALPTPPGYFPPDY